MTEEQFKERTKKVALEIIFLVDRLPDTIIGDVIGDQVLRSGTSIGLNYRAACRAKSTSDMILKLQIVLEEADETLYWLELIVEANLITKESLANLMSETNQIVAMTVASIKSLQRRNLKSKI